MTDRLFLATLTICVFMTGVAAVGSALVENLPRTAEQVRVVQLERVVVTGKRLAPASAVAVTERVEPATQRAQ
jgi:tRNA A37 threonylcarbamoyladenosine dehydratase